MSYNYTFSGRTYNFSRPIPSALYFEEFIDSKKHFKWMKQHWHYSIYFSLIYLIVIYAIQWYMKWRSPFHVRKWMAAWNAILALCNIWAFLRGLRFLDMAIGEIKFHFWICEGFLFKDISTITFYCWLFIYSKVVEFGDTIFIVLSKRRILFLHCYHHAATLVLTWYLTSREVSIGPVIGYTNVSVHSFMYTYFAFKALGYKIPRFIAMLITILQTSQMIFGVFVTVWAYWSIRSGDGCDSPSDAMEYAFCIYLSYAVLFCHLFYNSYLKGTQSRKKNV